MEIKNVEHNRKVRGKSQNKCVIKIIIIVIIIIFAMKIRFILKYTDKHIQCDTHYELFPFHRASEHVDPCGKCIE